MLILLILYPDNSKIGETPSARPGQILIVCHAAAAAAAAAAISQGRRRGEGVTPRRIRSGGKEREIK